MRIELEIGDETITLVLPDHESGQTLASVLRHHNRPLNTRCGEKDMCAGCTVELLSGRLTPTSGGDDVQADGEPLEVRACQHRLSGSVARIRIPQRSRLSYSPQVLESYRINVPYADDPLVRDGIGLAIDIGTTTVVVQAVALDKGETVATASSFNAQTQLGDDVLTRINLCSTDPDMVSRLQRAIAVETLAPLIAAVMDQLPGSTGPACIVVAGNTTMLHLLVGEDPSSLGFAPFTAKFLAHRPMLGTGLGLQLPETVVHFVPCISSYVGADLTAGLVASGAAYDEGPCLLVDVGTNGEILLAHDGSVLGCATAAGPAFEGSGLSCGIRAGEGAIDHISFDPTQPEVAYQQIGAKGAKPVGICGSAYIDLLSEGRRAGVLTNAGRIIDSPTFTNQLVDSSGGRSLLIAHGQGKRAITVSELDLSKLLQAKAAIAAGILCLLSRQGLEPRDIKTLYLAGGFGMHLNLANAIACGLLPGFQPGQVQLVGNTSLGGATVALMDRGLLEEYERVARSVETIELNREPGFEDTYIDQLTLP